MEIELSCQREVLTAQPLKSEAVVTNDLSSGQASEDLQKASRRVESVRNSRAA